MTENLKNHKKIISDLVEQARALEYNDQNAFHKLREKARMILNNIPAVKEYASALLNIEIDMPSSPWGDTLGDRILGKWDKAVNKLIAPLEVALQKIELFGDGAPKETDYSDKIFLVHGHDQLMKESVARAIESLGLKPIILHEKPNMGRTIIQKFKDYSDVGFAIVLLSPDDKGRSSRERSKLRARARQNVIFELGFFIGKLGQKRVLAIYKKHKEFEFPSDYDGVLYAPYDAAGKWQYKVVEELRAAGYPVDANKLMNK